MILFGEPAEPSLRPALPVEPRRTRLSDRWTVKSCGVDPQAANPSTNPLAAALGRASTSRLLLRRPETADLPTIFQIHRDPATNEFNPDGPDRDIEVTRNRLDEWQQHWDEYGFGYWSIEILAATGDPVDVEDQTGTAGVVIGSGGLRHTTWLGRPVLNMYYRFSPTVWGRGYAREMATFAAEAATHSCPDLPVIARTKQENIASQRTALTAGLIRRPDLNADDGTGLSVILASTW